MTGTPPEPWPITARICMWFTYAQVGASIFCHLFFKLAPRFENPDPREIDTFNNVRLILVPVLILELFFQFHEYFLRQTRRNVLIMSRIGIWEFCVKLTYYTILAKYEGGYPQLNVRAMGPPRPIYLPRWVGWSFAIPTLITMNTYPMMDEVPFAVFLHRIFPMLAATWAYCWSCYLGCVVNDMFMGWFLITLGCVAYVAIIVDQAVFVVERIDKTDNAAVKGYIILVKECVFTLYTVIWLLGEWDLATSLFCQQFYSFGDVTLKCTAVSLLHLFRNLSGPSKKYS